MATVKTVQLRAGNQAVTLDVHPDGKVALQHGLSARELGKHPKLRDSAGLWPRLTTGVGGDGRQYVSLTPPDATQPPITFNLSDVTDPKGQAQLVVEPCGAASRDELVFSLHPHI
jgi:hypothetical protein